MILVRCSSSAAPLLDGCAAGGAQGARPAADSARRRDDRSPPLNVLLPLVGSSTMRPVPAFVKLLAAAGNAVGDRRGDQQVDGHRAVVDGERAHAAGAWPAKRQAAAADGHAGRSGRLRRATLALIVSCRA